MIYSRICGFVGEHRGCFFPKAYPSHPWAGQELALGVICPAPDCLSRHARFVSGQGAGWPSWCPWRALEMPSLEEVNLCVSPSGWVVDAGWDRTCVCCYGCEGLCGGRLQASILLQFPGPFSPAPPPPQPARGWTEGCPGPGEAGPAQCPAASFSCPIAWLATLKGKQSTSPFRAASAWHSPASPPACQLRLAHLEI